jgi:hypothetical protein
MTHFPQPETRFKTDRVVEGFRTRPIYLIGSRASFMLKARMDPQAKIQQNLSKMPHRTTCYFHHARFIGIFIQ